METTKVNTYKNGLKENVLGEVDPDYGTTAQTVGTANAPGVAAKPSREDHIHSHGNQAGGLLHALVTTIAHGFMSLTDKIKLDKLQYEVLQYTNGSAIITSSTVGIAASLSTDRESTPAPSLLTKVNGTDFRTNFNGRIEISYRMNAVPSANNRGFGCQIRRNGVDLGWTYVQSNGKNDPDRNGTNSGKVFLNCSVNDIYQLMLISVEGISINIPVDRAFMSIRAARTN